MCAGLFTARFSVQPYNPPRCDTHWPLAQGHGHPCPWASSIM